MSNQKGSKLKLLISSCLMMSCLISSPLQAMDQHEGLALLPKETQAAIITYKDEETKQQILGYRDILNMQQVCKSWSQIASQGDLWVLLAQRDGFKAHPNMAFQAHYHYLKGKTLMGRHILADSQVELAHPIAQEMIDCLNKSAPYMHSGAIDLLMDLMNSPQIPLELSCIQVPENMNLMVYPLMSEEEILQKTDEEILQICSGYEYGILDKPTTLRDKLFLIIKQKDLPFLLDLFDKHMHHRQKLRDPNLSKKDIKEIFLEVRGKVLEAFSENKSYILERINKAMEEKDTTSIDLLIGYLNELFELTDLSSPFLSDSSSDTPESEKSIEEPKEDPYLPILEEANIFLESLKDYIYSYIHLSQAAKMGNYIDCLGTSLENEFSKKGFGPIEDPSIRGISCSNSYIQPLRVLFKEEGILLSLLRAGYISPPILDYLEMGLNEWKDDFSWSENTDNDISFQKYEVYGQLLFKALALKHPTFCFIGSGNGFGVTPMCSATSNLINFSPLNSRCYLMNAQLSSVSHGNFINLMSINKLLSHLESIGSGTSFQLEDTTLHPKICQNLLGVNSIEEFQTNFSRTHLVKLLELSKNKDNLVLFVYIKQFIQLGLGLMYLHLDNWEESKNYFLQLTKTDSLISPLYYFLFLPPEKGLEILDISDPNKDRGDDWTEIRSKFEAGIVAKKQRKDTQEG